MLHEGLALFAEDSIQTDGAQSVNRSQFLLNLGNVARSRQNLDAAIDWYQQAEASAQNDTQRQQAQINQLSVWIDRQDWDAVRQGLVNLGITGNVPPSSPFTMLPTRPSIYTQINQAYQLMRIARIQSDVSPAMPIGEIVLDAAQILAQAVEQAQAVGDRRAEAYALGYLGTTYEKTAQWDDAQDLTESALKLAQTINAPDISYQWHWQLGRILRAQGNQQGAIAAYDSAVKTLQSLRSDLVATTSELQFSFRENVEPIYREYVDLLLQPDATGTISQASLQQARLVIESLQIAELDNFFRTACLDEQRVAIDAIVQTGTAVIYPIILPDRLEIIVSLPQRPLRGCLTCSGNLYVPDSDSSTSSVLGD